MTNDEFPRNVTVAMGPQPVANWLRSTLTTLGFWVAVVLPVCYLPLLVTNLETTSRSMAILALFGIHVLALVVGRDYHRTGE